MIDFPSGHRESTGASHISAPYACKKGRLTEKTQVMDTTGQGSYIFINSCQSLLTKANSTETRVDNCFISQLAPFAPQHLSSLAACCLIILLNVLIMCSHTRYFVSIKLFILIIISIQACKKKKKKKKSTLGSPFINRIPQFLSSGLL